MCYTLCMEPSQIADRYNLVDWVLDERLRHLFSFITMNWRSEPLICYEVMLNLIGKAKTKTGLSIKVELENIEYPQGIKVPDAAFAAINIFRDDFHGDPPAPQPV